MKTPWIFACLTLSFACALLMYPGCASVPAQMATVLPPMPPMPVPRHERPETPHLLIARTLVMLNTPALPSLDDWGNMLAFGVNGTWLPLTNGAFAADKHMVAHFQFVHWLSWKNPPLLPTYSTNLWLMTSNQASEFQRLANQLRQEENIGVYSSGR